MRLAATHETVATVTATQPDVTTFEPRQQTSRSVMPETPLAPIAAVRAIVFVVGAASLGAEIAAARLLAPYFGASTIIWANTIATVLVALSVGYALGGRLADRRADLRGLSCLIVLTAAMLLALVPFVADPFLRLSVKAFGALSVGGFLGLLAGGARAGRRPRPSARHGLSVREPSGACPGRGGRDRDGALVRDLHRRFAVGTFASALLLIPLIGTHRTFITFALVLALASAVGAGSWRFLLIPVAVGALLAIPLPAIGADVRARA